MASKLHRSSFLARLGTGAGIGALALVTGACSPSNGGTDADQGSDTASAAPAAGTPAASSDSDLAEDTRQAETPAEAEGETTSDADRG